MKKVAITVVMIILFALVASSLSAFAMKETAVIRLTAFMPENTTFTKYDDDFFVGSYPYNFSYSIEQDARTKIFTVMAN